MAFNPSIINTNVPPPNYPNAPMQFPSHSIHPCPLQQNMFNAGKHVPSTNPSPFNGVPSNNLPSSSVGFIQNPVQSMWNNNNALNFPVVNNQNFTSPPPIPSPQTTHIANCFQAPPPLQNKQFETSVWNNHPQTNHNGLLAIASNSSSGINNFTGHYTPVGSDFQSQTTRFDGNHNTNKNLDWPGNNFSCSQPPPPLPMKDNNFKVNNNLNSFSPEKTWNPIQKTNVPDSSIFQNPSAIFNMTGSNELVNPKVNDARSGNYKDFSVSHRIPINQGNINVPQKFNSLHQNFIPINGKSEPNYNKSLKNQSRFFQPKNNSNKNNFKRFSQNKMQDFDYCTNNFKQNTDYRHNFKLGKPSYSEGPSQSFQSSNQNLIDVCAVSSKDIIRERPSNPSFQRSSNSCKSNSSSSIIEEFTISDSESIDSKNSPQKYTRNKRIFDNLQKIHDESSMNTSQYKMVWMTENIQKSLQKRNMLFKQAKTTNDPAVWDEYNKLKNEINEEIRKAKLNIKNNKPKWNPVKPKIWQEKGKKLPFNCDTCDRGFSSNDELGLHMELHIKCHYKGCSFEAHPKIVMLHQRMQHDTGYADVINKLQSDEEIKKWREERKRRFPTAENILKKKAEQVEKEARGEVIVEKDHGQFKKRRFEVGKKDNSFNRRERSKRKRRSRNPFQRAPEIDQVQVSGSDEESEYPTKLPKFGGMKNGLEYVIIDDDVRLEGSTDVKIEDIDEDAAPLEIPIQKGSLNESSDSADENDNEPLDKEDKQEVLPETALEEEDSSSIRLNTGEKSTNNENSSFPAKDYKSNKREKSEKRCRPPVPPRPKHSLLKMLLSDEIRHERNVIMQCVRHIVKNNFFRIQANT